MMQKKEKTPQTAATAQGENQNMQIQYISENFDCQAPGIPVCEFLRKRVKPMKSKQSSVKSPNDELVDFIKSLTTEQVEKIYSQLPQLFVLLEEPYRSGKPW